MVVRIFSSRRVENRFHLLEDLTNERFVARSMGLGIFDRVAMPADQIVVTEDALVVANEGNTGPVVLRIVEHVNKGLVIQFDANFEAIPPFFSDREGSVREDGRSGLPNLRLE